MIVLGAIQGYPVSHCFKAVWGMSVRNLESLGSNLMSVMDVNEFKFQTVYAVI